MAGGAPYAVAKRSDAPGTHTPGASALENTPEAGAGKRGILALKDLVLLVASLGAVAARASGRAGCLYSSHSALDIAPEQHDDARGA